MLACRLELTRALLVSFHQTSCYYPASNIYSVDCKVVNTNTPFTSTMTNTYYFLDNSSSHFDYFYTSLNVSSYW